MQKYAKKMVAVLCLFFISMLWYQSDEAEAIINPNAQGAQWFNIACVPSHATLHGLDTDLRKRGLSQFSKNIYSLRNNHRPSEHRCYFRVNQAHIGCFNPRLITKEYLEENGFDPNMAFPGGAPGQICYFKKEFANNYINLIAILKRNGATAHIDNYFVKSGAEAAKKLAEPIRSELQEDAEPVQDEIDTQSAEDETSPAQEHAIAAQY